ncbi:MAG: ribosome small subunit-dependent GTPase A [bacterium]|nr:ribosome small subunit-dependent GTPase A [bacterium]
MVGKIIKQISNDYTVKVDSLEYVCKPRGKFRNLGLTPLVGDNVIIDDKNKYILEIEKRKNVLDRPSVANIDQIVIITSVKIPDFSSNLLDKLLAIIEFNNIKPIICFTKLDLLNDVELKNIKDIMAYYKKIGYDVYENTDPKLKNIFKDKITVITGQSGAGKSSLLNRLDETLNLKIGDVSKALGRGRHTTRHTELISMLDGLIADTPGFSSVDFKDMSKSDIRDNFVEFNLYKDSCEYKDCMHINELVCGIKKNVENNNILKSRYLNYLKFIEKR